MIILPSRYTSRRWPRILGPRRQFALGGVGCKCCGGGGGVTCNLGGSRCVIPPEDLTLTYTFDQDAPSPFPPLAINLVFNANGPFRSTTGNGPIWLSGCVNFFPGTSVGGDFDLQLECPGLGVSFCDLNFTSNDESCTGTESTDCSPSPPTAGCDISAYALAIQCSPFMLTWTLNQTSCPPDRLTALTMVLTV
jgi:hypothetical protein